MIELLIVGGVIVVGVVIYSWSDIKIRKSYQKAMYEYERYRRSK